MKGGNNIDQYTIEKDKIASKSNIAFGVLFLVWTAIDVLTGFFEEYWYVNIFFALLGVLLIWIGIKSLRAAKRFEIQSNRDDTTSITAAQQVDASDQTTPPR